MPKVRLTERLGATSCLMIKYLCDHSPVPPLSKWSRYGGRSLPWSIQSAHDCMRNDTQRKPYSPGFVSLSQARGTLTFENCRCPCGVPLKQPNKSCLSKRHAHKGQPMSPIFRERQSNFRLWADSQITSAPMSPMKTKGLIHGCARVFLEYHFFWACERKTQGRPPFSGDPLFLWL